MKNLLIKTFRILTYLPFVKIIIKIFYDSALIKLKREYQANPQIIDILLTSNPKSKNFIYGHSDFNILIIVANNCHPKTILNEMRGFLKKSLLLELVFNSVYIPILTEAEFKTDTIKSFLVRKAHQKTITWISILTQKELSFNLRKQDQFALMYNAIQSLDYFLLKEPTYKFNRNFFKNTSNATKVLAKFYKCTFKVSPRLLKTTVRIQSAFFLSYFLKNIFLKETWSFLTSQTYSLLQKNEYHPAPIDHDFLDYLHELEKDPAIQDITLTPPIIQPENENFQGKIFLDIHLNNAICKNGHFLKLEKLKNDIKNFETDTSKFRIRLTTEALYKIQNELAFYPFPLEALYRRQKTYSFKNIDYNFEIDHEQIVMASIHFLTIQFMRFRSLQQKTELIGSKFIKSLNLMYKYYLLLEYLKTQKFKPKTNELEIRNVLTPQFSEIGILDEVTEKDWLIIKAQLKYLLKNIREELKKYDKKLKILRF